MFIHAKKAFTLAEVLITLLIIGVIASIVIPGLINQTNNAEFAVKLSKSYASLSQAYSLIKQDNGNDITTIINSPAWNNDAPALMNAFTSHLNIIKTCGQGITGCLHTKNIRFADGTTNTSQTYESGWVNDIKAQMQDGTMFTFQLLAGPCNISKGTGNLTNTCGSMSVDTNGEKGPNTVGKDLFVFWITKNGIVPLGSNADGFSCSNSSADWSTSNGCTAQALKQGSVNY